MFLLKLVIFCGDLLKPFQDWTIRNFAVGATECIIYSPHEFWIFIGRRSRTDMFVKLPNFIKVSLFTDF